MAKEQDQANNYSMKGLNPIKAETLLYLDRLEDEKRN
jgi:hypothetical protein